MAPTNFLLSVPVFVVFFASIVTDAAGDAKHSRAMQLAQKKGIEDGDGSGYYSPMPYIPPSDGYPTTVSPPYVTTNPGYVKPPYKQPPTIPMYPGYGSGTPNYGTPSDGGYGTGHGSCTFWSSNHGSWPDILSSISTISAIFGKPAASMFGDQTTLLQALENSKNDAYSSLLREGTAALINSYAYKGSFPFSPDIVKTKFDTGLVSSQAATAQATEFARANTGLN